MAASPQIPQWKRITRQTITLTNKNILLFRKAWISTLLRALIAPIVVTLVFCLLRDVGTTEIASSHVSDFGIPSSTFPVRDLADAIKATPSQKLVFVRNGISSSEIDPAITGIISELQGIKIYTVDDPNDLFKLCKQSLAGNSDCFAAIIFQSSNETTLEYVIAVDQSQGDSAELGDWRTGKTRISERIMPLQWAVNSHLGGFSTISSPLTRPGGGQSVQYSNSYLSAAEITGAGNYW